MTRDEFIGMVDIPTELEKILSSAKSFLYAGTAKELEELSYGGHGRDEMEVSYSLDDGKIVKEAIVSKTKNGISVNYIEPYMRRRDPDCMFIGDDEPSDKPSFKSRFGYDFAELRKDTFDWLSKQDIAVFTFEIGQPGIGGEALAICPANAGFFAFGLALLQGIVDIRNKKEKFKPSMLLYIAPPFRHTRFSGKQVVVHNRSASIHEIFSYNLYPGPSAKKGVYGALINKGTMEGWVTAHCSAVQVITPYDNVVSFMHEGASGGGKSEMLQQPHRLPDGRMRLGKNLITGEERFLEIPRTCELHPVCDDMGLCHPSFQEGDEKLWLMDAEEAWFVRVNHIESYGTDHDLERLTISPPTSLLFLNIDAVKGSTALIWEHIEDAPGVKCPNPRVIIPRKIVEGVVDSKVSIDVRSFGVRTPPCTKEKPSYGIIGLFHVLPPALAWLWRLVSPRGHSNPSIVEKEGMSSEGVGSYWPFATGRKVDQANLLLKQFSESRHTRYILTPNQHIGAWECGFMPQWIARDYLARKGHARFRSDQISLSRCPLLGYSLNSMRIEGLMIPIWFLKVESQPEVGIEAYDKGAEILTKFFHSQIESFLEPDLLPLGKQIIEYCLSNGNAEGYWNFIQEI